jgi:hypothetical protein
MSHYVDLFYDLKKAIEDKQRAECLESYNLVKGNCLAITLSFHTDGGNVVSFDLGLDYIDHIFAFLKDYYDMTINDIIKE